MQQEFSDDADGEEGNGCEAVAAARRNPHRWLYKIDGEFAPDQAIPPEAIVGAWDVDGQGNLSGDFMKNPNYKSREDPVAVQGSSAATACVSAPDQLTLPIRMPSPPVEREGLLYENQALKPVR